MTRVRIVGGGLMGVLAALEAHRLGARRITLHERDDRLGGELATRTVNGLELRETGVYFGGREDPVRKLLEWHGATFDDFDNHCGSLSPCAGGEPLATRGFAGPVLAARDTAFGRLTGEALTDRLRSYPSDMGGPLTRYAQWRLGVWLDEVHASAAGPLGIDQVHLAGARSELLGPPAALPRDGFTGLFAAARRALTSLGVEVRHGELVSPRECLETDPADTVTIWTPPPGPLFAALGKTPPKAIGRLRASYVLAARGAEVAPFVAQNFTTRGSLFRVSLYPSRGETLLLAECVAETPDAELRQEIQQLMEPFGGAGLTLGDTLSIAVRTVRDCPSVDFVRKVGALRSALAQARGPGFVTVAWECADFSERFRRLARSLGAALAEDLLETRSAA